MTNIEIRRKILEMLYERFKEHPYYRIIPKEFKETLDIDLKALNYNIIYLEEKGYVELQKPLEGNIFVGARITTKGTDIVEDEYQFDIVFPITKKQISAPPDALKEFDALIDKIRSTDSMDDDAKELIIEYVVEIKKEFTKDEPSYPRVKSLSGKIKRRDVNTSDQVKRILGNPTIAYILRKSSKRES